MRSIQLELPEESVRSLEMESEILEFESVPAYVRWVLAHRFTVESNTERDAILGEYAGRLQELRDEGGLEDVVPLASGTDLPGIDGPVGDGDPSEPEPRAAEPSLTMGGDVTEASPDDATKVDRIEDESLADTASALSSVETSRIDEFARRAVSQTSDRLGTSVNSGLSFESETGLSAGSRPGAHVADLDDIDVPGWDEDLVERRRVAVGAALEFISDVERARRSDFVDELYEEYPAGYESESAWWDCLKRGLRQVDRVIPAREDSRIWRFESTPGRVTRISDPSGTD